MVSGRRINFAPTHMSLLTTMCLLLVEDEEFYSPERDVEAGTGIAGRGRKMADSAQRQQRSPLPSAASKSFYDVL